MRVKPFLWAVILAAWLGGPVWVQAGEITPAGRSLADVLDSMHVERLWLAGRSVEWRTGELRGKPFTNGTSHTHCSAFAAAAAERLGVYLLHPPEHSSVLLANAQQEWLRSGGMAQGWLPLASPIQAQQQANAGELVVVTCKNANTNMPGHIAIVRPSLRSDAEILSDGPEIIQAGAQNFSSATTRQGFKHHPGAFEHNELLYFSHKISPSIFAQAQTPSQPPAGQPSH